MWKSENIDKIFSNKEAVDLLHENVSLVKSIDRFAFHAKLRTFIDIVFILL